MQISLFDSGQPGFDASFAGLEHRDLGSRAWLDYLPNWLEGHESVYLDLARHADWKQQRRRMYERTVDVPRLTAPLPVTASSTALLGELSAALAAHYRVAFESVSLAWYRDGSDSVAPHGDRIGGRSEDTVVAIVSVGAPRRFVLRPAAGGAALNLRPGWGDLLVMGGSCQRTWLHAVPKLGHADPRISIQFRARVQRHAHAARERGQSARSRRSALHALRDRII